MSFKTCRHSLVTADVQPLPNNGILVFVVGTLQVDEDPNALLFTQVFVLMPLDQPGQYFLHNDMFRFSSAM